MPSIHGKTKAKMPSAFATTYPETAFHVVTPDNYMDFMV